MRIMTINSGCLQNRCSLEYSTPLNDFRYNPLEAHSHHVDSSSIGCLVNFTSHLSKDFNVLLPKRFLALPFCLAESLFNFLRNLYSRTNLIIHFIMAIDLKGTTPRSTGGLEIGCYAQESSGLFHAVDALSLYKIDSEFGFSLDS